MKATNHRILLAALTFILAFLGEGVTAQNAELKNFAEKQFYGNRIKGGSLLMSGSFQHTGYADEDREGTTGRLGFGLGIGLSENVTFNLGYRRDRTDELYFYENTVDFDISFANNFETINTYRAGFRFLPNTVGGFVQPYFGFDYIFQKLNSRTSRDGDITREQSFMGFQIPVGVTLWVSTFMAVSLEPVSLSLLGETGEDTEYDGVFNANLNLLNPTFSISFLVNGRKP